LAKKISQPALLITETSFTD